MEVLGSIFEWIMVGPRVLDIEILEGSSSSIQADTKVIIFDHRLDIRFTFDFYERFIDTLMVEELNDIECFFWRDRMKTGDRYRIWIDFYHEAWIVCKPDGTIFWKDSSSCFQRYTTPIFIDRSRLAGIVFRRLYALGMPFFTKFPVNSLTVYHFTQSRM